MPQYVQTEAPAAETDLHANLGTGTGTYQTGTAPKTLQQKIQERNQLLRQSQMAGSKQKVNSYAPGSDPKIAGRRSFSDEQGD